MRFALLAVSVSCAFSWQAALVPRPAVRGSVLPRAAPTVAMAMEYDKLREALLPADNKDTFRNALGLQPLVWGLYSTLKPAQSASMFLGITVLSGLSLTLFKLVAMMHTTMWRTEALANSPSSARSGSGRPPASASLGQLEDVLPRPASVTWGMCYGWPATPALVFHVGTSSPALRCAATTSRRPRPRECCSSRAGRCF